MRRLARLKESSARWLNAQQRINDAIELAELDDDSIEDELRAETDALEAEVERLSFLAKLSGKYDAEDAYLAIHAGAGGTDAQDWAQMLLRMYLRWAERRGFKVEVVDQMPGDEAGVQGVAPALQGAYAYGYLKPEAGVHRRVARSPLGSNHRPRPPLCLAA